MVTAADSTSSGKIFIVSNVSTKLHSKTFGLPIIIVIDEQDPPHTHFRAAIQDHSLVVFKHSCLTGWLKMFVRRVLL